MKRGRLGLIDHQNQRLATASDASQHLPPVGRHHRVAVHKIIGEQPLDPLVAHRQLLSRARQRRRQIHQIGAPHVQHRRNQQCQLPPLRLALTRKPHLHIRRNRSGQNLDPAHSSNSALINNSGILESHGASPRQQN